MDLGVMNMTTGYANQVWYQVLIFEVTLVVDGCCNHNCNSCKLYLWKYYLKVGIFENIFFFESISNFFPRNLGIYEKNLIFLILI